MTLNENVLSYLNTDKIFRTTQEEERKGLVAFANKVLEAYAESYCEKQTVLRERAAWDAALTFECRATYRHNCDECIAERDRLFPVTDEVVSP